MERQPTQQPDNQADHEYKAKNAARATPAVASIAVITTAAAKQYNQQDNNEYRSHSAIPSLSDVHRDHAHGISAASNTRLARCNTFLAGARDLAN